MLVIKYGSNTQNIDVTEVCFSKLLSGNVITIPSGDNNRARFFTDPLVGILKKIFVFCDGILSVFAYNHTITIDIRDNTLRPLGDNHVDAKIAGIHSRLQLKYGSFQEELPEQKMAVRYLTGNERVLEIGGNIGRNSLVICDILHDQKNLVTLECDPNIANQLIENRKLNNFGFNVECSALSKRMLIQRGWNTIPSDIVLVDYTRVDTTTFDELQLKYNIVFDTLVLDCEGAFYYILSDMPELLNHIQLIVMENDYTDVSHKHYIDAVLTGNNFRVDYVEAGGWGPCYNKFFEVWKRSSV
jgi:FkbM family methyltransferase